MPNTVSAVIPAYNAARWISRSVESCLAQTYPPVEIIVVDDGSTDKTADIVSRFPAPVRLVQQPNAGPAAARNHGARLGSGDWIGLLDADDYWFPEKLETQLLGDISADIGVLYSRFDTYNGSREPMEVGFNELWDYNWIGNSSALIRRTAFDSVGGFHDVRTLMSVEDHNLWIRLAAAKWRLVLCPHILVHYERDVGISSDYDRLLKASLYNIDHLEAVLGVDPVVANTKRLEIREDFARRALGARRMGVARKGFLDLLSRQPSARWALYMMATFAPPALLDLRRSLRSRVMGPEEPKRHPDTKSS